ncbi:TetR/AcrR family transcriptional regulator [Streptomyces sp. CC224B]|uniref:TetR/AcrR family transcriptional regulator n=1 Tax=Streptomyces sp. CC224B TaxID=3044571 RepID=UPI0024A9662B|nr:TetR/AcrR family transcriptional regulator [Streptomyces sp. CC224B]
MPRQTTSLTQATPEHIAQQALLLVDRDGPTALSFRTLAAALNISVASLQRRCTDLAGLLDLVTDHLAARLPEIPAGADWATATEQRFTALYELLTEHPGLVILRGDRPWLGPQLLKRLVEPQLADSLAAGMSPQEAIVTYRRLYLLTLGSASFVNHRDPKTAQAATRRALAALDPQDFPVLTGQLGTVLAAVVDHETYYGALRQLIRAADPARTAGVPEQAAERGRP